MSLRADIENAIGDTLDTLHMADVARLADALMPLVERAVREGALQMAGLCVAEFAPTIEMPSTMLIERADAIVARIMEGGR